VLHWFPHAEGAEQAGVPHEFDAQASAAQAGAAQYGVALMQLAHELAGIAEVEAIGSAN